MIPEILTIDGVNDEFILAYHCPEAAVLTSGYHSDKAYWSWHDTKNRFPLEDCGELNDYATFYDSETTTVYISRRGNILTFAHSVTDDEPLLHDEKLADITHGIDWMNGRYNNELNDPENIYIIDMSVDDEGHVDFVLIDDKKFVNTVGKMDKSEIYQEVQKYIRDAAKTRSYEQAIRMQCCELIIKDGVGYDDIDR